ncbi:MAG: class I SAM-dependent methyltransferase [Promethearchaeota archaeon]
MKEYWNHRFSIEEKIWGDTASKTAEFALKLFLKYNVRKILIPGAGYGRNTKLFSTHNFDVTGIEISPIAYDIAKVYDPRTIFFKGSVLDMPFNNEIYDAIYCHNVLHLFLRNDRVFFLKKCYEQLKHNGFIFFTVFSEKEKSFGRGKKIENNTFESKPGRPTHYFSEENLIEHFKDFSVLETGLIEDSENHGELGPHTHKLRFIFAQKRIFNY